jgi:hypothetical protein
MPVVPRGTQRGAWNGRDRRLALGRSAVRGVDGRPAELAGTARIDA